MSIVSSVVDFVWPKSLKKKIYKDKEVKKNDNFFLSMCDVKVSLTFTSLNMVLR
jgi:hypothetical protein